MMTLLAALAAASDLRPAGLSTCDAARAATVTVQQLAAAPERFIGRCVTVSGPTHFHRMYSSVRGSYLAYKPDRSGFVPRRHLRHRIGLYFGGGNRSADDSRPSMPDGVTEEYRLLTVTGVAYSCERMGRILRAENEEEERRFRALVRTGEQEDATITIRMLGGYCHYDGGGVVWVTQARIDPAPRYQRLTGERARTAYGNLVRAPREWQHTNRLRRLAGHFLSALVAGDRERLGVLHGKFGASREELRLLLDEENSPFRELRDRPAAQVAVFVAQQHWSRLPPEIRPQQDAHLCYCRERDCRNRWPIAVIDTKHRMDHPYVCVEVDEDATRSVFLRSRLGGAPLAEPNPDVPA